MRCVTYRRVSTEIQREEGFSLEAQKLRLKSFADSQGWTIVDDYADEGYSAKNMNRPALQRLIADMKLKKFDVILIYRLDRFVRSVADLHNLLRMMDTYDVKFKSATESFDTTSATGRMFISIIATLAQWERETIAERVYDAMLKRSEQGKRNGAPAPYGYDLIDKKMVINQFEANWVKFMFSTYQTHGSQNIAKKLNSQGLKTKNGAIWSDFSVRYTLRNPIYAGYVRWNYESFSTGHRKKTNNPIIVPIEQNDFEPIITKKEWDDTQKLLEERKHMAFRSETHYPFSGVAKCYKCGKSFTGSKKSRKDGTFRRFYKCQGRFKFGICDVQTINEKVIEKEFLKILDLDEVDPSISSNQLKMEIEPEQIKKQLNKAKHRKERLKELYIDGDISKDKYRKKMEEITSEEMGLAELLEAENEVATESEVKKVLKRIKDEWENIDNKTKKLAIRSLFDHITIELVTPSKLGGKYTVPPVIRITDYQLK